MSKVFFIWLFLSANLWAGVRDYRDITTLVGPCAQSWAVRAKDGDFLDVLKEMKAVDALTCADAWLVRAYCELKLESDDAVDSATEAVRRNPQSAAAHLILVKARMQGTPNLFSALMKLSSLRKEVEMALELDPECHQGRAVLVGLYGLPGIFGGDEQKMKMHLEELERRSPYDALLARGRLDLRASDFVRAASCFQRAREMRPGELDAEKGWVEAISGEGRFDEAFASCRNLIQSRPKDFSGDAAFVRVAAITGQNLDEALAALERCQMPGRQLSPFQRAIVEVDLAIALKRAGREEEGEAHVTQAESYSQGARRLYKERIKAYERLLSALDRQSPTKS